MLDQRTVRTTNCSRCFSIFRIKNAARAAVSPYNPPNDTKIRPDRRQTPSNSFKSSLNLPVNALVGIINAYHEF